MSDRWYCVGLSTSKSPNLRILAWTENQKIVSTLIDQTCILKTYRCITLSAFASGSRFLPSPSPSSFWNPTTAPLDLTKRKFDGRLYASFWCVQEISPKTSTVAKTPVMCAYFNGTVLGSMRSIKLIQICTIVVLSLWSCRICCIKLYLQQVQNLHDQTRSHCLAD